MKKQELQSCGAGRHPAAKSLLSQLRLVASVRQTVPSNPRLSPCGLAVLTPQRGAASMLRSQHRLTRRGLALGAALAAPARLRY